MDLLGDAFVTDPYPYYAYLRQHAPLHRTKQGSWVLTRHADIVGALSHRSLGNEPASYALTHARNRDRFVCADVAQNILPFLDGARQTALRRTVASAFRKTTEAAPVDIEAEARELLAPFLESRSMEIMDDFARPLAVRVIMKIMGLPQTDAANISGWVEAFFYLFAPISGVAVREKTDAALTEFRAYLQDILITRKACPDNAMISRLLAEEHQGARLTDAQIVDNCMLLLADGIENVDAAVANAVLALDRHPAELQRLRDDSRLLPQAVEESLRYDAPAQTISRIAVEPLTLHGQTIRKESVVILALGSANRDPDVFEQPDRFSLVRDQKRPLGFGMGRHACVGAALVRMEMTAALRALLNATVRLEVCDSGLEWQPRLGHRWLKALPVILTPS